MRRLLLLGLVIGGVLANGAAQAFTFTPTEAEWTAWPEYCKARYVTTIFGSNSAFALRYPRSESKIWNSRLGETTFTDVHHYCAALASISRARVERDPKRKAEIWRYALQNAMYTFRQAPTSTPIYPQMAGSIAQIQTALGHPDEAVATVQLAINAQPKQPGPYVIMALLYRDQGKKQNALDVLRQANTVTEGQSAEVLYNLGLIELETGDVESAAAHAREAYALGYPLPGLKKKLQAAGAWSEPPPSGR